MINHFHLTVVKVNFAWLYSCLIKDAKGTAIKQINPSDTQLDDWPI